MANISRPRGTNDIPPGESPRWQYLEEQIRRLCRLYGYQEIRTPIFEHTELFERGVGGTTDIVEKEMYTFKDRGGRSITLRPEGTAGAVRLYLENNLAAGAQPTKMYYLSTEIFRYERPQAGRLRQHHQFGVEAFGAQDPALDAEVIGLAAHLLADLGLKELSVHVNSIGCPVCRAGYRRVLQEYYEPHRASLCEDCRRRVDRNPLRLLDCKVPHDRELAAGAPRMRDHLCEECAAHFQGLQEHLADLEIPYEVDTGIVRGLDYYTKTVFEIIHQGLGAQNVLCGGGRYDGLIEEIGGPPTPGVGFGMGMERLLLTLEKEGIELPTPAGIDVFVAAVGEEAHRRAVRIVSRLRRAGVSADMDYLGRSLRKQMKFADKYPSRFVLILGEEELATEEAPLRDMRSGEQWAVPFAGLEEFIAAKTGGGER